MMMIYIIDAILYLLSFYSYYYYSTKQLIDKLFQY